MTAPPRSLAEITAYAIRARCGHCWAETRQPCDEDGTHLARYARAARRGLISAADMAAVLDAVAPDPDSVFTPGTVLRPEAVPA